MNTEPTPIATARPPSAEEDFRRTFAYATGLYPNPGTHEGSCASYWGMLKRYPLEIIKTAFGRAVHSSPEFFPSAVRVRECAEAASKTATLARPDYSRPAIESREFVPAVGAGHDEWISEGVNAFEQLGRFWQVESKANGWDRNVIMPQTDGLRRWREFWATWNKTADKSMHLDSSPATTSGMHQAGSVSPSPASGLNVSQPSSESSVGGLSHGDGCVCELCMPSVMARARLAGVM